MPVHDIVVLTLEACNRWYNKSIKIMEAKAQKALKANVVVNLVVINRNFVKKIVSMHITEKKTEVKKRKKGDAVHRTHYKKPLNSAPSS